MFESAGSLEDFEADKLRRSFVGPAGVLGVLACLATLQAPNPIVVWNASASMAIGLYLVIPWAPARRGDAVIVTLPRDASALAARRGYLPASVPAIKRVAAVAGDEVCARGDQLFVNGKIVAAWLRADAEGRPLEAWRGCRRLGDEILVLGDDRRSFDGRYFGPISQGFVIGRARLLWAR